MKPVPIPAVKDKLAPNSAGTGFVLSLSTGDIPSPRIQKSQEVLCPLPRGETSLTSDKQDRRFSVGVSAIPAQRRLSRFGEVRVLNNIALVG
jgi:hypothetical protein